MSIVLIGVSWIVNIAYAQTKQLKSPIFLDYALNLTTYDQNYISLYYLANANDDRVVTNLQFGDVWAYSSLEESKRPVQKFAHYALRQAVVYIDKNQYREHFENGRIEADTMRIRFSDGTEIIENIKEFSIQDEEYTETPLNSRGGSAGSDWDMNWYEAEEDLTIEEIAVNLGEEFQEVIEIRVNAPSVQHTDESLGGTEDTEGIGIKVEDLALPLKLKEGENLYIRFKIDPDFIGSIYSTLQISGRTTAGESFTTNTPLYTQPLYLDSKSVQKIVDERRDD